MNTLIIGFLPEGSTDIKFLSNIITRTAYAILFSRSPGQIDVNDTIPVKPPKQTGRDREILDAAILCKGYNLLIVHSDADDVVDDNAFNERINPGFELVKNYAGTEVCRNLVPIVPISMTESWMLADREALKAEIGTAKSDHELTLDFSLKHVEKMADPKTKVAYIFNKALEGNPKRKSRITLADIYQPLSERVDLNILEQLESYRKFKDALTVALLKINYIV